MNTEDKVLHQTSIAIELLMEARRLDRQGKPSLAGYEAARALACIASARRIVADDEREEQRKARMVPNHIDLAIESLELISINHKLWRSAEYPQMWTKKAWAHVQLAIDALERMEGS